MNLQVRFALPDEAFVLAEMLDMRIIRVGMAGWALFDRHAPGPLFYTPIKPDFQRMVPRWEDAIAEVIRQRQERKP